MPPPSQTTFGEMNRPSLREQYDPEIPEIGGCLPLFVFFVCFFRFSNRFFIELHRDRVKPFLAPNGQAGIRFPVTDRLDLDAELSANIYDRTVSIIIIIVVIIQNQGSQVIQRKLSLKKCHN
jgi:hypothetical protein